MFQIFKIFFPLLPCICHCSSLLSSNLLSRIDSKSKNRMNTVWWWHSHRPLTLQKRGTLGKLMSKPIGILFTDFFSFVVLQSELPSLLVASLPYKTSSVVNVSWIFIHWRTIRGKTRAFVPLKNSRWTTSISITSNVRERQMKFEVACIFAVALAPL